MPDLFISYSRKDSEQALQLADRLRDSGVDVWIDQHKIDVARSWSNEIVQALDAAKAMLVLLSPASIQSDNVVRELSLAFEAKKPILPVVLEPVTLPTQFRYQLAGIQHAHLSDFDAIFRALTNLGIRASASIPAPEFQDSMIHLAVLPFDDLSPAKDNEWFADGLMEELIHTLGSLNKLHVNPKGDVVYYKKNRPKLSELAADLKCRYVVEGGVQKSGEKIRIRVSLSDALEHHQLWSEKYDGTFDDIFEYQERTAKAIVESLRLKLTPEEEERVAMRPTESAEAYELAMKAREYFSRHTLEDFERSIALYQEAGRIDPKFAVVHASLANAYLSIFRLASRTPEWLVKAEAAVARYRELEGETARYYWISSVIALRRGNTEEALSLAEQSVALDEAFDPGYDALAFAYQGLGRLEERVEIREKMARRLPNDTTVHSGLISALHELGDPSRLHDAVERAIPIFERHIRLNPEDYDVRVRFANMLLFADRKSEALAMASTLRASQSLGGLALYNLACLYANCGALDDGIALLKRAIGKGYRDLRAFRRDPDLNPLRNQEEFLEIMSQLAQDDHV